MAYQESRYTPPGRVLYVFCALIGVLSFVACVKYPGYGPIYVVFAVLSNALLYFGFRRNAIFFDTFIGILFWLGFWLKLSFRVAFMDGQFHEPVGNFDGSGAAFDRALLVASCGFAGLLAVSFVRERYLFAYPDTLPEAGQEGLLRTYQNHRMAVLSSFVILFVAVSATNAYFGMYQRGAVPRTVLPYGLNGIYSWLLLFGLASISALILHCEFTLNRKTSYLVVIVSMVEEFFASVSLLSRGMIVNVSALGYGIFRYVKLNAIRSPRRFWAVSFAIFMLLFGSSVVVVQYLRSFDPDAPAAIDVVAIVGGTKVLLLDRWVGIEGVMAVSSHPKLGWGFWSEAWKETHSNREMSFYDRHLITSPYREMDSTKHHYISLPGIVAFCFYPGSFPFVFLSMFILGGIAAAIEMSAFKLGGGNVILCALLAQVVAYRYAHFGYAPSRSYMLFGSLYLTLFIFYLSNKFLLDWQKRTEQQARGASTSV